jgi:hypothetical protein
MTKDSIFGHLEKSIFNFSGFKPVKQPATDKSR